jgi:hypothetical protein
MRGFFLFASGIFTPSPSQKLWHGSRPGRDVMFAIFIIYITDIVSFVVAQRFKITN